MTKTLVFISFLFFMSMACAQEVKNTKNENKQMEKVEKTKEEWKGILDPMQFFVTRENGTESPFTGKFDKFFEKGTYVCVCCSSELFESSAKYNSGCGWPAFSDIKSNKNIVLKQDKSHGMIRTEVRCARCDAHLGHLFNDGPPPTGLRYCINSVALDFIPLKK